MRFATLLQLLLASLIVGLVLTWLDIEPDELIAQVRNAALYAFAQVRALTGGLIDSAGDIVGYVLVGAVIVVPVWLLSRLWKALRRRS